MVENQFISSILKFGAEDGYDFDGGFSQELLLDAHSIRAYKFIEDHVLRYRKFPATKTFTKEFPDYVLKKVTEPPDYYGRKVHENWLLENIKQTFDSCEKSILDEKIVEAFKALEIQVAKMSVHSLDTNDTNMTKNVRHRFDEYNTRAARDGMVGISYPWETLNDITGGMEKGQFIVFTGQRKTGKTWSVIKIAHHVHRVLGLRVLFISPEMRRAEICRRFDALDSKLDYNAFRKGLLTKSDKRRFKENLKRLSSMDNDFYVSDTSESAEQVNIRYVDGKILKYRPDLVILDAAYLMMDEFFSRDIVKRTYNLTRYGKGMAKRHKVPLIFVTQMLRGKETGKGNDKKGIDDIQWGDSFAQDCDLMVKIESNDMLQRAKLTVLANREGPAGGDLNLEWDFSKLSLHEVAVDEADDGNDNYENGKELY